LPGKKLGELLEAVERAPGVANLTKGQMPKAEEEHPGGQPCALLRVSQQDCGNIAFHYKSIYRVGSIRSSTRFGLITSRRFGAAHFASCAKCYAEIGRLFNSPGLYGTVAFRLVLESVELEPTGGAGFEVRS
jgi:hypothetical protein